MPGGNGSPGLYPVEQKAHISRGESGLALPFLTCAAALPSPTLHPRRPSLSGPLRRFLTPKPTVCGGSCRRCLSPRPDGRTLPSTCSSSRHLGPGHRIGTCYVRVLCFLSTFLGFMWGRFSCVWRFVTPWTVAGQAPLSMGLSRKEYWSGAVTPFSRESSWPRDRTCVSCIAGRFFTVWATREATFLGYFSLDD